jgi:hypothetical protein
MDVKIMTTKTTFAAFGFALSTVFALSTGGAGNPAPAGTTL